MSQPRIINLLFIGLITATGSQAVAQFIPAPFFSRARSPVVIQNASLEGSYATNPTVTVPVSATQAGNLIAVGMTFWGGSCSVASVTDNKGNSYASAGADALGGGDNSSIWYAKNTTAGVTAVTANITGCNGAVTGWVTEVAGMSKTSPLDVKASMPLTNLANPSLSASVSTSANANEFIMAVIMLDTNVTTQHAGNPFTLASVVNGNAMSYLLTTTTGTYKSSWDVGSTTGNYVASIAAFKP